VGVLLYLSWRLVATCMLDEAPGGGSVLLWRDLWGLILHVAGGCPPEKECHKVQKADSLFVRRRSMRCALLSSSIQCGGQIPHLVFRGDCCHA
jgi:hypothetical protein